MCSGTENPKVEQKARLEALQNALEARSRGHGFYPTGKRNGLPSIVGRPSAIPAYRLDNRQRYGEVRPLHPAGHRGGGSRSYRLESSLGTGAAVLLGPTLVTDRFARKRQEDFGQILKVVALDFALGRAGVEDAKMLSRYDSQSRNVHS
jgi:hypothetical protein